MGVEGARQELVAAGQKLEQYKTGVGQAGEGFTTYTGKLEEMLPALQELIPAILDSAVKAYETGTQELVAASKVYKEKVQPHIEASGVAEVDGRLARDIARFTPEVISRLKDVTNRIMADLFKDDVFAVAKQDIAAFTTQVNDAYLHVRPVVAGEDAILPGIVADASDCQQAIAAYAQNLKR